MDNKSLDCFACEGRARGVKVEISPQNSFVMPHEHFIYSEFKADDDRDLFKITFVTHEVVVEGFLLRRVENAMVNRDLSWLCARAERFRPQNHDRPFITKLTVRPSEESQAATTKKGENEAD